MCEEFFLDMVRQYLTQIDAHQAMIDQLTERIEQNIGPFRSARDALVSIPGVSTTIAQIIIAETGADMTAFPTAAHLASWAGVCPGLNQSAGRIKSSATTHGNAYLKAALGIAALSASRAKGTYLAARYRRILARRGPARTVVAIEHTILTAVWHMLHNGESYTDLGPDHFARLNPDRTKHTAIRQLENPRLPSHDHPNGRLNRTSNSRTSHKWEITLVHSSSHFPAIQVSPHD